MGSPLSPIIADLVIRDLEEAAIERLSFRFPFYYRYVDNIILATPRGSLDQILQTFNSLHEWLQYAMEMKDDGRISFLDIIIINDNNIIIFDL